MSATPRLSSADAAWLHMDRPTNLMVINSVLLFDERLDWERFAEVVRTRLVERYPRFHRLIAEGRTPLDGPHWREDPDFELSRHLHRRGLAAPGDEQALRGLAGDLAAMSLDRGKPLWDMYLIDGPGAGSAVIVRMHHCIADGIALAQVMLSLTDTAPGGDAGVAPAERDPDGRWWPRALVEEGLRTLAHPGHALELLDALAADAQALAKLVFTPRDEPSALKHDAGAPRSVAWSRPLSLARVKAIAHAQDATVNDVLLAAVSGALRDYLIARGEEPRELRTLVPVNLRAPDRPVPRELGNRFGLVFLTLPVDRASRRERLRELKRRMDEIKASPQGPVSYAVLEAIGHTPTEVESRVIDIFTAKASAVMTNVSGPRETVYLAGSPLRAVLVWAPTAGSVGMSVSILSYDGAITVGLLVHAQLVPDPQAIVERLQRELAAMARLAPAAKRRAA